MTIWVWRDGRLVEKYSKIAISASPYISRLEPYRSPIDGKEITSWRERDRDLRESNSYDPRDRKVTRDERPEPEQPELPFTWADTERND